MRWGYLLAVAALPATLGCDQSFLHGVPRVKSPSPPDNLQGNCVVNGAPTMLTAGVTGPTTVDLMWMNTATNAEEVVIERRQTQPTMVSWDEIMRVTDPGTTHSDTVGTDGVYEYRAEAVAAGCLKSGLSNQPSIQSGPAPATDLAATAQATAAITLIWSDGNTLTTNEYRIERRSAGTGIFMPIATRSAMMGMSFTDGSVSSGTAYDYRVIVISDGGESVASAPATLWSQLEPASNFVVTKVWADQLDLSWTDPNSAPTAYVFYTGAQASGTSTNVTMSSHSAGGLSPSSMYDFSVVVTGPMDSVASAPTDLVGASTSVPPMPMLDSMAPVLDSMCSATFTGSVTYDTTNGAMFASATGTIGVVSGTVTADGNSVSGVVDQFSGGPFAVFWTITDDLRGTSPTIMQNFTLMNGPDSAPPISPLVLPAANQQDNGMVGRQAIFRATEGPVSSGCGSCAGPRGSLGLGRDHSCVVTDNAGFTQVKCWGSCSSEQLGNGHDCETSGRMEFTTTTDMCLTGTWDGMPTGVRCDGGMVLTGAVAVTAGEGHTCVLLNTGEAVCIGDNGAGALGNGDSTFIDEVSPTPVCLTGVWNSGCSPLGNLTALSAGRDHTCAVTTSGTAYCWGAGWALGDDMNLQSDNPVQVCDTAGCGTPLGMVVEIGAGNAHTCALLSTGAVKCWGQNLLGRLGAGLPAIAAGFVLRPVDVCTAGSVQNSDCTPLTGALALAVGYDHSCVIIAGGEVRCWGDNNDGKLGSGATAMALPESHYPVGVCLSGTWNGTACAGGAPLTNAIALALGRNHSCVLLDDSGAWCWGRNSAGQLGNGLMTAPELRPTEVCAALSTWSGTRCEDGGMMHDPLIDNVAIAAGDNHTCLLDRRSGVRCFGDNGDGRLGNNSTMDTPCPVPVCDVASGLCTQELSDGAVRVCSVTTIN